MGSLTQVTIDFDKSHLVFPTIIACILCVLGLVILTSRFRLIAQCGARLSAGAAKMDKMRFIGTLMLTLIYFSVMVPVGDIWPNTGSGFLYCSIPYVLLTGLLFMHDRRPRNLVPLIIVAVFAPVVTWYLFTDLFFLTLP